jgi:hypothetical protein
MMSAYKDLTKKYTGAPAAALAFGLFIALPVSIVITPTAQS